MLAIVLLLGATVFAVRAAHAAELRTSAAEAHNRAVTTRIDEMARGRYREHVFANVNVTHDVVYDGTHPAAPDRLRGRLLSPCHLR